MKLFEKMAGASDPEGSLRAHRARWHEVHPSERTAAFVHARRRHWKPEGYLEGEALGAWFLGPKGENGELLERLIKVSIERHVDERKTEYPQDPEWITQERKDTQAYRNAVARLEAEFLRLLEDLGSSVPFYSYRYQGHMLWDVTLPGVLGYFAAMLHNQNNVAAEASPVTTFFEQRVGDELCQMLGYELEPKDQPRPWGHITCDGSVANAEALWAARNLKYYPLGLAAALSREEQLRPALGLSVKLPTGQTGVLVELDAWQLLNLEADVILELPQRMKQEYGIPDAADAILEGYTLQHLGFLEFRARFAARTNHSVAFAPATMHYSWPKSAALIGLGRAAMRAIPVDLDGRMDVRQLRQELDLCLRDRVPVVMVVGVAGSTVESAVDPLATLVKIRKEYRALGLEFWLHADAAWGGYFASMLRAPESGHLQTTLSNAHTRVVDASLAMSRYVNEQYRALPEFDSITVDPHKAGYIPYPAGGLCHRNSATRHLVAFTSPVVFKGETDPTVGVYGIEGSKPGAAAAATYLSHRVIRPNQSGYGRILGRCLWNSKRFYANLVTMVQDCDPFRIIPLQRLPVERKPDHTQKDVEEELRFIRENIVGRDDASLLEFLREHHQLGWFRDLGSDQLIVTYAFNFERDGVMNTDVELCNRLNAAIFGRLSLLNYTPRKLRGEGAHPHVPMFVTSSRLEPATYGSATLDSFKRRLGLRPGGGTPLDVLITTTMDPWLTDTGDGNFIPTLIRELRLVVNEEVGDLIAQLGGRQP